MSEAWVSVAEQPRDDSARQVLADELSRRGDPLGEFITLHTRYGEGLRSVELLERLHALWQVRESLAARFGVARDSVTWSRGLPSRWRANCREWLSQTPVMPLERLDLDYVEAKQLRAILSRPAARRLTGLTLRVTSPERWSRREVDLLDELLPAGLRHLGVVLTADCPEFGLAALTRFAARLTSLTLTNALPFDLGSAALEQASFEALDVGWRSDPPSATVDRLMSVVTHSLIVRHVLRGEPRRQVTSYQYAAHGGLPVAARGPLWGRWQVDQPVGARPGLAAQRVACVAEPGEGTRGVLLHATTLSERDARAAPLNWFAELALFGAGVLDSGDADAGDWCVLEEPETATPLVELVGRAGSSADSLAGAFAAVVEQVTKCPPEVFEPRLVMVAQGKATLMSAPLVRLPMHGVVTASRLRYLAPEEVLGQRPTRASHCYSLAALLAQLAGARYSATSDLELLNAIRSRPLAVSRLGFNAALARLLRDCLHKRPEHRPPLSALAEMLKTQPVADLAAWGQSETPGWQVVSGPWLTWRYRDDPEPLT